MHLLVYSCIVRVFPRLKVQQRTGAFKPIDVDMHQSALYVSICERIHTFVSTSAHVSARVYKPLCMCQSKQKPTKHKFTPPVKKRKKNTLFKITNTPTMSFGQLHLIIP